MPISPRDASLDAANDDLFAAKRASGDEDVGESRLRRPISFLVAHALLSKVAPC
ncbi:MAG: hypothetical protein ACJAVR_002344 [Paracoccaceae bacterium]|jgi:hypothetical protein